MIKKALIIISSLIFILLACHEDELEIFDYRYKVDITQTNPDKKTYINTPIPLKIEIQKNEGEIGDYSLNYTFEEGEGSVTINDKDVKSGEGIALDKNSLLATYIPTTLGKHRIKFQFSNKEFITEKEYLIEVENLMFYAEPKRLPKKLLIERIFSFDLALVRADSNATAHEYKTNILVLDGAGKIVLDQDSTTTDTDPETKSLSRGTAKGKEEFYLVEGDNTLSYISNKQGKNVLQFSVENEYGFEQTLEVPLEISLPDFSVQTHSDTIADAGATNNFLLDIKDIDQHGQNTFQASYRNIKNSGTLKINGNELQVGSTLAVKTGENVCEFIPAELGEAELEFIVRDKYNTTRKDTATFNVQKSETNINVSDHERNITVYNTQNFNFAVSKRNYKGNYKFEILQDPLNSVKLKVNGADYTGGQIDIVSPHNTLVTMIPSQPGDLKLTLVIYDDYGSASRSELLYTVANTQGKFTVSNHKPTLNLLETNNFNFAVSKPNYDQTYQFEITQFPINGTIKINGKDYTGGRIDITNPLNTLVNYTPTGIGETTLTLIAYDVFGGSFQETLHYSISNTGINISINNIEKGGIIFGRETTFDFSPTKEFYTGDLRYEISMHPEDAGKLKVDGKPYSNFVGAYTTMLAGSKSTISFTPTKEGEVTLVLRVYDTFGGETSSPVTYVVTNPQIKMEVQNYSANAVLNTENLLSFAINKESYSGNFFYTISTTPSGSGLVKVDGKTYEGGKNILEKPDNTSLSFTSSKEGDVELNITITDEIGGRFERVFSYKSTNPPLNLQLSNLSDNLTLMKQTTFMFAVNKANYSGDFYYQISNVEGASEIKVNATAYIADSRVKVPVTTGTSVSFIPTQTGKIKLKLQLFDEWGKTVDKDLEFTVTNSDITLNVTNVEAKVFVGKTSTFNFLASKPNYTGNLKYEIVSIPENMGTLVVDGKNYVSGKIEFQAGKDIPVIFTPVKEGEVSFKVNISDEFGGEKAQTITQNISNPAIQLEVANFTSEATFKTEKNFSFSTKKEQYAGSFNYSITTVPEGAGTIKINEKEYTGGVLSLEKPDNTKVTFTPSMAGEIVLTLNVTDNVGGKIERSFTYNVTNPEINLLLANLESDLTLNKTTSFNFSVIKANYKGKYTFSLEGGENCKDIKVNDIAYTLGASQVISVPNGMKISFAPTSTDPVKMVLKVADEWGMSASKELLFSVTNSDITLNLMNVEAKVFVGKASTFNFLSSKPNYTGSLKYEIISTPENMGTLVVDGKNYVSGKIEFQAGKDIPVIFTPTKEGEVSFKVNISDEFGGEKALTINQNISNPAIQLEVTDYTTEAVLNTEKNFNFSTKKEQYAGSFNYSITTTPSGSGILKINDKIYTGGVLSIEKPDNTKVSFTPSMAGEVVLTLNVTDNVGGKTERTFTYNVSNPELDLMLANLESDLTLNKTTSFNFAINKANYTGKFNAIITGENCKDIKLNDIPYSQNTPQEVSRTGTRVSFSPTATGTAITKIHLTITDDWGKSVEKDLTFNVTNSGIDLAVKNVSTKGYVGADSKFNFKASKPNYAGNLKYEIVSIPGEMGTLVVDGKNYVSGEIEFQAGKDIPVIFTPAKEGEVSFKINISDEFGGKTSETIAQSITNPQIKTEIVGFIPDANLNVANGFNFSVAKDYYSGKYNYIITTNPANAAEIKVNDIIYSEGLTELTNPTNTRVTIKPLIAGKVTLNLIVMDETGSRWEKAFEYNIANNPLQLVVSNQETALTLDKETSFNFSVNKANYTGKYIYEIISEPVVAGILKVNGANYEGGKVMVDNPTNTKVTFIPNKTGATYLTVKIEDDFGGKTEQRLSFSVANSKFSIITSNVEKTIQAGKATVFNYSTVKENYAGKYQQEIIITPEDAGEIKINGNLYSGGKIDVQNPVNTVVEYTSQKAGQNTLQLLVYDEFGGEAVTNIAYNCVNPEIVINTTNKEDELIYNTRTNFNVALSKKFYTGNYKYQVEQLPANSGTLYINDTEYDGGISQVANPDNLKIGFIPTREGHVSLKLLISDEIEGISEKIYNFNVTNPELVVNVTNHTPDVKVNTSTTFNFTAAKANYAGKLMYQIEQSPAGIASLKVNGTTYTGGKLELTTPLNNTVEFTANKNCAIVLKLTIFDEWGKATVKDIPFSVVNTDISVSIANKEQDLLLSKETSLNFTVNKPNYSGGFKARILDSDNTGAIKLNGNSYSSGSEVELQADNNTIVFTPKKLGAILLKLQVIDELEGEKEVPLSFNVTNPAIKVNVTNKEDELIYNTLTNFNVALTKEYYVGTYDYEIEQIPANSGSVTVDGVAYPGGNITATNHSNIRIGFVPTRAGRVSLKFRFTDKTGAEIVQNLDFNVTNPAIAINVTGQTPDVKVHNATTFNFNVSKANYTGKFQYQLEQSPEASGALKVNGVPYTGGKIDITNINNNSVEFTANQTGATTLKLTIFDEWGISAEKLINYSVSNTDILVNTTNKEFDLLLNKATTLNFTVSKPNYAGTFKAEIISDPEDCGTIKLNNSAYTAGKINLQENNTLVFTPSKVGAILLKLKVYDDLQGEKEIALNFNVANPGIDLTVTNKQENLIFNTATSFNVAMSKDYYTGAYDYVIEQIPANSGSVTVDGAVYSGGLTTVSNPSNLRIGFTPNVAGRVSLKLTVKDKVGAEIVKNLDFNVKNPVISVNVTGQTKDIQANTPTTFNFSVAKENYTGKFQYQLEQSPEASGTLKVNGVPYTGGKIDITNINSNSVEFTPTKLGAVILRLRITDTWGMTTEVPISYSVSNTDIISNITDNEYNLLLNKATTFQFTASKPNYSGTFKAKIVTDPESTGTIRLNNAAHTGTVVTIQANNTVIFTPSKVGAVMMKIVITDDLGGEKEIPLSFNVTNPGIDLTVTNKQENLIFNTATSFNVAMSKDYYTGAYDYVIEQIPANSGSVTVDGAAYSGGLTAVSNPSNLKIGFTPNVAGRISLKLTVKDKVGAEISKIYDFNVTNPDITLNVTGQTNDIKVNTPTTFNFSVAKASYPGKFQYEIEQTPAGIGTIKVNGVAYSGGKVDITNINSNSVEFTANKTGSATLKLSVFDEWGKSTIKDIPYSISNTDVVVNVTNKEFDLILNKATTLNFTVSKPNYAGTFKAEIISDPEDCGTIKLNSSAYTAGKVNLQANNTLVFTPSQSGAALLTLKVYDDLGGEKEIPLNFNITNPVIGIAITNKESSVIYKSTTTFNAALSKANYSGKFRYRISTTPAAAGAITVGGKAHDGNYTDVANPAGLQIGFTPVQEGYVSLLLEVEDETGSKTEKNIDFNVTNPTLNLTINNTGSDLTLGSVHNFSISASKQGYTGGYTYEITQYPYAAGDMTVGGSSSLSGKLTSNPTNITFKPSRLGAIVLNVKISDEWGKTTEKQLDFNVENSPITLAFLNNQSNIVLNNVTNFNFKATKANYSDNETVTYSITPTSMGAITVDGKTYNGTGVSVTYGKIKNGLPVTFTPNREGVSSLTFMVTDSYGTTTSKTVDFNVANPELSLFLSGVNTSGTNEVTLGETFKYTFNVDKPNYTDDFGYMITLDPADAGTVATSDITPRSLGVVTGTLQKGSFGVSTGEIRFTPSNSSYLNQNVKVNVEVRDKWGNKKETSTTFMFKTSAINVNMNRKTSIPVEEPYMFYFTVDKASYSGKFTYQFAGWNEGDKIETSADGTSYKVYNGGKFELPHKDHTYIRYTPAKIGTVPLKLFIYDENNVEVMRELTFDVKTPEVKLIVDKTSADGNIGEFIPFKLTATEEKGEDVNVSFALESTNFTGTLRFNGAEITPVASRSRAAGTTVIANSGKENKYEILSFKKGTYATTTTAQNRWGSKASVTTSINVTEKPRYTITTSTIGSGTVSVSPSASDYESGAKVTFTATPEKGWKFVRWQGSNSSSTNPLQLTVNGELNVVGVFEKNEFILNTTVVGQGNISRSPNSSTYESGMNVTLSVVPASGWKFIRWEGDASGSSSSITVNMNNTKNIKAIFEQIKTYTLTVNCGTGGSIAGDIKLGAGRYGTYQFTEGTIVKLLANPGSGWKVSAWKGDLSGVSTQQTIIMDRDKNCSVSFTRVQ